MRTNKMKAITMGLLVMASTSFYACKGKQKDTNENTTISSSPTTTPEPAPVEISGDETLRTGVQDATKDHPGVTAEVRNGEITLTGTIERSKLQGLIQSLNSLRPKKINNNLNIK